jgi:ABC-type branched-subunit amino acid transport system substrate-binding protein
VKMGSRHLALALLLTGCSLGTVREVDCTSHAECRDAFGFGSTCGEEGFCEESAFPARCPLTEPADLAFPLDSDQYHVMGTVFDHTLDTHVGRYRSAALAASQANSNGGLDGREFAMIHCTNEEGTGYDDLLKADASVATASWLADEVGVPVIIGPAASSDVEATYNGVSEAYGTLLISPSATSPSLTPLDGLTSTDEDPGLLWRTAPPDDTQALAISDDMVFRYIENVAVIYQTGAYGEGLEEVFTSTFPGDSAQFPFDSALGPADAVAEVVNDGSFDEVLFVSSESEDVVKFLLAADQVGFGTLSIFLTDSARNTDVLTGAASASELFPRIRGTAPATPAGAVYDSFAASYAAANGGEDVTILSYTAQSFDAAWLAIDATAWAIHKEDTLSGLTMARGLRKVSDGPPIDIRPTAWNEVKARFAAGESVDVYGASGPLDYDPTTGETQATIEVWVIDPETGSFATDHTFSN